MQHLLLLHGAIGAKDQLEPLAICLQSEYHVQTIDFNGHGKAFLTNGNFCIEGFAHDVIKFLDENNIDQVAIFGYSMGGYVAMWMARNYPQKITRIITLATKFHWDEGTAIKEIEMLNANTIEEKLPVFAAQLKSRHGTNWKELLEKTKQLLLQLGNYNILQIADYACITTSCLILLGDKDKMVTLAETIAVYEALPNGKYISLPNTTHPIERVDLPMLAGIIKEFIQ